MPYYTEVFHNRGTRQQGGNIVGGTSYLVQDSVKMTSHRSRPHSKALGRSVEVSDLVADPYAAFLSSTSERKYQARLTERGLPGLGIPDRGHSFDLQRHTVLGGTGNILQKVSASTNVLHENILLNVATGSLLNAVHAGSDHRVIPYKETALDAFAQQAYNRSAPSSVVFDAGQFLGELREGLPNMTVHAIKNSAGFFRSLGSGYLGVEFGWKPFINDILNAARALGGATELLSKQGERVHRNYGLPAVTQIDTVTHQGALTLNRQFAGVLGNEGFQALNVQLDGTTSSSGGFATQITTKSRRVQRWFEGEFTSFYPLNFDPSNYFSRLEQLVSVKLDPATLWELAPWSWMVDWFLRIGDSIEANQKASDDLLIMHYGYAMEHSIYTTEYSWKLDAPLAGTRPWLTYPTVGSGFITTEYKKRLRANPYGFKVGTTGNLTQGQFNILGALGLTKLR
jgi:hypothetical protein